MRKEKCFLRKVPDFLKKEGEFAEVNSFRTGEDFFSEQPWKLQECFVHFKDSKGSYGEKD